MSLLDGWRCSELDSHCAARAASDEEKRMAVHDDATDLLAHADEFEDAETEEAA